MVILDGLVDNGRDEDGVIVMAREFLNPWANLEV